MVKLNEVILSTGFYSLFLLRRHYRCYTTLAGFSFDTGNVERKEDLSLEDFRQDFDAKKPVRVNASDFEIKENGKWNSDITVLTRLKLTHFLGQIWYFDALCLLMYLLL